MCFENSCSVIRDIVCRLRVARFFLLIALLAFFSILQPYAAQAQGTGVIPHLQLQDSEKKYDLSPFIYVTPDPEGTQTYKNILENHLNGRRGNALRGNVLNLGLSTVPYWVVFSVRNDSWTEKWVLSLGRHMDGRMGLIDQIFLYDYFSGTKYLDTLTQSDNPYVQWNTLKGEAVPLSVLQGEQALFIMYIRPKAGLPATMNFDLMPADIYLEQIKNPFDLTYLANFFFISMIGFFAAAALFRRMMNAILFISYYMVQFFLFHYQNDALFMTFPYSNEVVGWIFSLSVILGILIAKSFLDVSPFFAFQRRIILGFLIGIVATTAAATFLISSEEIAQPLLMFAPSLAGIFFIFILSLAQGYNGSVGAYQFAGAWLSIMIGIGILFLGIIGILPPFSYVFSSYWYGLLPQGILFMTATGSKYLAQEREIEIREHLEREESETVSDLKKTKEETENLRLQRLIEHERIVMNELREREIQQNEEMRKSKEFADEANRAKSAFLAVVSHEIRTPMSGIMGMVRLLMETNLTKEQNDYNQTIQDSGEAMLTLLNDILDFEKIESGKMELEHVDFDLHRLINGVITLMSGHAESKGITLTSDMDSDIPHYVVGDPARLRQVLLNLIGNSIKFTAEGGVTVHVHSDHPSNATGEQSIKRIRFSVEDTGIGISKEAQVNLFSPFSQADSSITRKFGGTGLGLTISQRLIEAMGGKIQIDSIEDHGSTFFFVLIMEEGDVENVQDSKSSLSSMKKAEQELNVLIVEDNEINRKLLKEFVSRMGHKTSLAVSGEEAMEIIETQPIDLVLMDIELPGMSGMGTTKAIRALANREKAAIPVIALSGNVRDEDIRQCYAANMNAHLGKPVDPKSLQTAIDKVIKGNLDNPVSLDEEADNAVQMTTVAVSDDVLEKNIDFDLEDTEQENGMAQAPEKPPIMAALLQNDNLTLSEDDLDEDSFETALQNLDTEENNPPEKESNPVFDQTLLVNLKDSVDPEQFQELIDGLFERADEIMALIKSAFEEQDIHSIATRAHELKGMAGNFGLVEMRSTAAQIEDFIKASHIENLEALLSELPAINERAKIAVKEWMA